MFLSDQHHLRSLLEIQISGPTPDPKSFTSSGIGTQHSGLTSLPWDSNAHLDSRITARKKYKLVSLPFVITRGWGYYIGPYEIFSDNSPAF